jgi:hypothetical protein
MIHITLLDNEKKLGIILRKSTIETIDRQHQDVTPLVGLLEELLKPTSKGEG